MKQYVILGINPVPWKAPLVAVIRARGKPIPKLYSPAELKNYQDAIREAMAQMVPPAVLLEDDNLELRFYFWRQARTKNDHQADATNMQKATEDALQGILFKNDRQVQHVESWIMEQGPDTVSRIVIEIGPAPEPPAVVIQSDTSFVPISHGPKSDPTFNVEEVF